jgi:hypothetical protein
VASLVAFPEDCLYVFMTETCAHTNTDTQEPQSLMYIQLFVKYLCIFVRSTLPLLLPTPRHLIPLHSGRLGSSSCCFCCSCCCSCCCCPSLPLRPPSLRPRARAGPRGEQDLARHKDQRQPVKRRESRLGHRGRGQEERKGPITIVVATIGPSWPFAEEHCGRHARDGHAPRGGAGEEVGLG